MAFPHIDIKATNIELTEELKSLLEKRLKTIERLIPEGETDLLCEVELEKTTDHHQTGNIFRAEINLKVAGDLFRAESTQEKIETAIDKAKNEVKKELRRKRGKRQSMIRRGGKRIKDLMRFGN